MRYIYLLLSLLVALPASAQNATPATVATEVVGDWTGALALPGGQSLRLAFHVSRTADGGLSATMDSPDQGAFRIPAEVSLQGGRLLLNVPSARGRFEGALRADGKLAGSWVQGGSLPLELERGNAPDAPARPQEPRPPLPYRSEEVRYRNAAAGIELAGTLTTPQGNGPFPAVVLISGSG